MTKLHPSKHTLNALIERNDLQELKAFHKEYGIGDMNRLNYDYHIKCYLDHINSKSGWDSTNKANARYWSCRAIVLDSIISHPMFRRSSFNLPPIHQQLLEVA